MGAKELWLIRHGESEANVAALRAERSGAEVVEAPARDADVALSELGIEQARAVGAWLRENAHQGVPTSAWVSPYVRARQTLGAAMAEAGLELEPRQDERIRDRELGILDLLTSLGVDVRHPEEAERRRWLGKFYYRPPGGESWADVALRIRSFLRDLDDADDGGVSLVVAHDAVIMLFLYVCDGLAEEELLDFAQQHTVGNATVTRLVRPTGEGRWSVGVFADASHLERVGVPTTEHGGDQDADIH